MNKQPIGIFDSGVGGLTVFKEIRKRFPHENIIYFGDTARVPYGPKSRENIISYSVQNARFLLQLNAKIIVVACNTSSSVALNILENMLPIPVIGVIEPGAKAAVKTSKNKKIGVIGTEGTINSAAYTKAIYNRDNSVDVIAKSCPLFVPIAEEGWENHDVAYKISEEYLSSFKQMSVDTLVLGCTHYPILKSTIQSVMGNDVKLVDSAIEITNQLEKLLPHPQSNGLGRNLFYVSDNEMKFKTIANRILEEEIEPLFKVRLGESWYIG